MLFLVNPKKVIAFCAVAFSFSFSDCVSYVSRPLPYSECVEYMGLCYQPLNSPHANGYIAPTDPYWWQEITCSTSSSAVQNSSSSVTTDLSGVANAISILTGVVALLIGVLFFGFFIREIKY